MTSQPVPSASIANDPGRTLGIVGLVLAILLSWIGAIISIVAFNQSRKAGYRNNIALAGIIVGAALFLISIIIDVTVLPALLNQMSQVQN